MSGRGIDERQRAIWVMARPATSEVDFTMKSLCNSQSNSSPHHIDRTVSRIQRDRADILKLISFLVERNPFDATPSLRSISTVDNVDRSLSIGNSIMQKMDGNLVTDFQFKRSDQSVAMVFKSSSHTDTGVASIESELLFQRFITASDTMKDVSLVFDFELCSFPPALFEKPGVMRTATKSALADALRKRLRPTLDSQMLNELSTDCTAGLVGDWSQVHT